MSKIMGSLGGRSAAPGAFRTVPGSFRREQGIDEEGYLVAYLGQQAPHKGIDTLIRVFPALLEQHPSAWLAIGGARTPFTAKLEQLITRLPASARARVRLVSDLSPQMKADLLGDCDVFASPSQAESFGITTLEAWSLGRPVVVGDSPSQRSIVKHGVSGLIVPYGNAEELLAALGRLTDKETRAVLGRQGRERLERHYRRSVVEMQYALLLREAAQTDRREPSANGL